MPEVVNSGHVHADALPGGQAELNLDPILLEALIGEVDSNANGSYHRFESGLQVCWRTIPFGSDDPTWVFPAAFTTRPVILASAGRGSDANGAFVVVSDHGAETTAAQARLYRHPRNSTGNSTIFCMAVGRWK